MRLIESEKGAVGGMNLELFSQDEAGQLIRLSDCGLEDGKWVFAVLATCLKLVSLCSFRLLCESLTS